MVSIQFVDEPVYVHGSSPLRIGTDCSGIEAPIQALRQLGIPYKSMWCSDIDKYCIQSIKANYNPERIYGDKDGPYPDGDIRNRDHSTLPDIDLYVCGFPCQPFSQAGKGEGLQDRRGNVFFSCIDTIKAKKPKYFILENVKGILWNDKRDKKSKYGYTWTVIWHEVLKLKELGYYVDWKIMNTREYGIPQNRERIYIIGTLNAFFDWPNKCKLSKLENYVENDVENDEIKFSDKRLKKLDEYVNCTFIDLSFLNQGTIKSRLYSCCLNTRNQIYCVPKKRLATINELLMLQGFDINFIHSVSDCQIKKQIGNSMSVNVLKSIFIQVNVKFTE